MWQGLLGVTSNKLAAFSRQKTMSLHDVWGMELTFAVFKNLNPSIHAWYNNMQVMFFPGLPHSPVFDYVKYAKTRGRSRCVNYDVNDA